MLKVEWRMLGAGLTSVAWEQTEHMHGGRMMNVGGRLNLCCDRLNLCWDRLNLCWDRLNLCCDRLNLCWDRLKLCWDRLNLCCDRLNLCCDRLNLCWDRLNRNVGERLTYTVLGEGSTYRRQNDDCSGQAEFILGADWTMGAFQMNVEGRMVNIVANSGCWVCLLFTFLEF
jgi:hypothetical protein